MNLWARHLAGDPLTDEERAQLLAELRADPELRSQAVEDFETHGLLRTAARVEADAEAFAALVGRYVAKDQEGTRFLKAVQARMGRSSRRRFWRRPTAGSAGWAWGLAAAGVLLLVAVWASRPSPAPPPVPSMPIAQEAPPAPPPVPLPPPIERPLDLPLTKEPGSFVSPPAPAPVRPPPAPPAVEDKREPAPAPSEAAVARVEGGPVLLAGHGHVAESGTAILYTDGTRLELEPGTVTRDYQDRDGKHLRIEKGAVRAVVAPQPAGRPMIFATPHGEAVVLGTTLRLDVGPGTRLEVEEGKVRLKADGRDVLVQSGHFAVAASGVVLRAEAVPKNALWAALLERGRAVVNFGPDGAALPAGTLNDSGAEIDAKRGYGWLLPNDEIVDPGEGRRPRRRAGLRAPQAVDEPLKATRVTAGSKEHAETWTAVVPDGLYALTICVGDFGAGLQGPHHVEIQGRRVIDARFTKSGEFLEVKDVPVQVRGGPLSIKVGGHRSPRLDEDGTSDTVLNYIVLRRIR